eukprot:3935739-Rhodomonas_salina.1
MGSLRCDEGEGKQEEDDHGGSPCLLGLGQELVNIADDASDVSENHLDQLSGPHQFRSQARVGSTLACFRSPAVGPRLPLRFLRQNIVAYNHPSRVCLCASESFQYATRILGTDITFQPHHGCSAKFIHQNSRPGTEMVAFALDFAAQANLALNTTLVAAVALLSAFEQV